MKRFLLLATLGLLAGPTLAADDISKVNGSIHTDPGVHYRNLETVNGSIHLANGAQARAVETVNGSINVGDDVRARHLETVNGAIRAGRNLVLEGDVETVNGSVFVDRGGRIGGGVETVNGSIGLVATQVEQGIETVNGDITVGIESHVRGGLRVKRAASFSLSMSPPRKPRIVIGPGAVVEGPLSFEREVTLYVHDSASIGTVSGASVRRFATDVAPKD